MLRRARPAPILLPSLAALAIASTLWAATPATLDDVRLWSGPEGTRLVLDLSAPVRHKVFTIENPDRVVIDLLGTASALRRDLPSGQGPVRSVRSGPQTDGSLRVVLDLAEPSAVKSFTVGPEGAAGHRLVVELPPDAADRATRATEASRHEAVGYENTAPNESGQVAVESAPVKAPTTETPTRTLASTATGRDLVIAVDAGHGGQDPGAIGRGGTREKEVTLAIARRLARAIDAEEGMRAVLIRDGDFFVTLRGRIVKARDRGADLFVSVHSDSVLDRSVSGASVYVLSLRGASDEAARWLAERENAADLMGGVSLDDKNDVLASVLLDVTQKEAVSNSVEAAERVLGALRRVGSVHRPRVQHAGFVVLKSPDIPSMLVETAFISNAADERKLRDPVYQQRVADAIHAGVRAYFEDKPPPGTRYAALAAARRGGAVPPRTVAER
jgi:N-acetylmuramoyl-L-alanine amidase